MMSKPQWTIDQQKAIESFGQNIIVSAGAGSGKTAVLTARIIKILKSGIKANQLLVLTFTKASAAEMKKRVVDEMLKDNELKNRVLEVENAYITTFDSFAMSIVKKYHYLLNLSSNIKIIESSVLKIVKKRFMQEIFETLFSLKDENFLDLIDKFTLKSTKSLQENLLDIDEKKLDLLVDKEKYLNDYLNNYYDDQHLVSLIKEYELEVFKKINQMKDIFENVFCNNISEESYKYLISFYLDLFKAEDFDDVAKLSNVARLQLKRNSEDIVKSYQDIINDCVDYINDAILFYPSKSYIKQTLNESRKYAEVLINIFKQLEEKTQNYKIKHEAFIFSDIAKMALRLVKEFNIVKNELKNSFYEILIDEYQDTSDIQEAFINEIANNNVYMVGDIKQSIYRFRNANPDIFKEKYNLYKNNIGGMKIDLNKNFRSNKYILNEINKIFSLIMDDKFGSAEYRKEHQLEYGLKKYDENPQFDCIEFVEYNKEEDYNKDEIEIFYVLKDIKEKIDNKILVYDKDIKSFRPCKYADFAILIDRSTSFEKIKQIFDYYNLPLSVYKKNSLTSSTLVFVLQNTIKLWIKIKENSVDDEFRKCFFSVGRSFLFNYTDQQLFDYLTNSNYADSTLYQTLNNLEIKLQENSIKRIILTIIDELNIYEKLILIGDIEANMTRIQYLINIADNMETLNMDIYEFVNSFEEIFNSDSRIEFDNNSIDEQKIKLMSIHNSKGLEFPICYFLGNYAKYNFTDLNSRFLFDLKYGFIIPVFNEGIKDSIVKKLMKNNYYFEEKSEKIRLLYVALTRCRERMIVLRYNDGKKLNNDELIVKDYCRENYKCFKDIYDSISNVLEFKKIYVETLNINDEYLLGKKINFDNLISKTNDKIKHIHLQNLVIKEKINQASKQQNELIDIKQKEIMEFGTHMHKIFETFNFKNPNYHNLTKFEAKIIKNFINLDLLKNISQAKIYKEHEFIFNFDNQIIHGIIDLILEYETHIDIIDYKLKNIDDEEYLKQLNTYKTYLFLKTNKNINIYLYSLINNTLKML